MTPVGNDPMTATVALTSVGVGHAPRHDLHLPAASAATTRAVPTPWSCTPPTAGPSGSPPGTGCPGATMQLTAATALASGQIRSVEVTRIDGSPVAWASVPL